jgi:AcrR family transcriptional regulator
MPHGAEDERRTLKPAGAPRAGRAERGSINAEQIIAGALALAEEVGIDGLTMPKLARRLGIGVTSIYWYFRSKDELIEALQVEAARAFHATMRPPDDPDWPSWLYGMFLRLRQAMRANRVYCDLLFMRGARASTTALEHTWPGAEAVVGKMAAAGFTPHEALQNLVMLSLYTRGAVVLERQIEQAGLSVDDPTPVPAEFVLLSQALTTQNTRGVSDAAYEAQLRLLIEGMVLRLHAKRRA